LVWSGFVSHAVTIATGGQGLFLTYNVGGEPIPEPGTWAAALLLTGLAAYMRRRAA
jgi:hypothetical protein